MMVAAKIFIIFSVITIACADKLKFVSVLYRHGHRAPAFIYPTDPYPPTTWSNGIGQLTNFGKDQAYQLGKYIRELYKDFLPSKYHEEDIYVLSSDVGRTLMTAYCVLAGLYEPQGDDIWSPSINWQPIPVHSLPADTDILIFNNKTCPKYLQLLQDDVFIPNWDLINRYKGILEDVFEVTHIPMPSGIGMALYAGMLIYDCLNLEEQYGLDLPEWSKTFYPEPLREITIFVHVMTAYDVPIRRIRCGPLLKDIIQHLEEARQGKSILKMRQYSGHDTTLVDLMQCLDVYDGDLIPFGGALFFELYETESDFEVVVNYKKGDNVTELVIPGCKSHCPLDLFKELLSNVLPDYDNWDENCKL